VVRRVPDPGPRTPDPGSRIPTWFHSLSRVAPFGRLPGMNISSIATRPWLTLVVAAHLIISVVHGMAHNGAHVPLSAAGNLFVLVVIVAGPLAGVALMWWAEHVGSWIVALAMAGALIFGFLNHFVFASPDHVARVATEWRPLFETTAVLLALTEALGFGLALRLVQKSENVS